MIFLISLDKAKEAISASEAKAKELNIKVSTAIVDEYGILVAFSRMDGALVVSPKFSHAKACTSAALGLPSESVAGYATEGKPYFGVNVAFGGEFMVIAGGLPIKNGDNIMGGIGVGGSLDVSQDVQCAQAALSIFNSS